MSISAGLGYVDNEKSALITRGLTEMERQGMKLGALPDPFWAWLVWAIEL